ncbi:hypothetical protein [Streptomyces celluloflavus]|uniref:hypothetical protein n=1 Tax=Streptomyces celluloflavus TaxID=58344 RepID=UPI003697ABE1
MLFSRSGKRRSTAVRSAAVVSAALTAAVALPASTAQAAGMPLASSINNVAAGGCVTAQDANYHDGKYAVPYGVTLENCKAGDLLRQKWVYNPLTKQLSSAAYPARCITDKAGLYTNTDYHVLVLEPCNATNVDQRWERYDTAFRGEYKIQQPGNDEKAWRWSALGRILGTDNVGTTAPEERYKFTVL